MMQKCMKKRVVTERARDSVNVALVRKSAGKAKFIEEVKARNQ